MTMYIHIYIYMQNMRIYDTHININACDVANPMPNLPFGDGSYQLFMTSLG